MVNEARSCNSNLTTLTVNLRMHDAQQRARLTSESAEALKQRGDLLLQAQRPLEALQSYEQALMLKPDFAEALKNRGNALRELGRLTEALNSYQQALTVQPGFIAALNNCGVTLQELDRPELAADYYRQALQLQADAAGTLTNYAATLQDLGQPGAALMHYQRALQLQPDSAAAHFGASLCYLLLGDFAKGWQEYEWRWQTGLYVSLKRTFTEPPWLGESALAGKTILLHAEQGLGDTLQFCRYVSQLAAQGAKVLLEVQAPLKMLLAQLPGVAGVYAEGEALPRFDCHCPLLSLPLALRTQLATIPACAAYLSADPEKSAYWAARLRKPGKRLIGLAWSGNEAHVHDRHRSIPLAQFAPLFSAPGSADLQFVCVQNQIRDTDRAALSEFGIVELSSELHDFTDTAALLACVDRVITVDTVAAHLGGALGRPTTVMLPYRPDSRWLLGRADSPWYPTLNLLRQETRGDWRSVLAQVAASLPQKN